MRGYRKTSVESPVQDDVMHVSSILLLIHGTGPLIEGSKTKFAGQFTDVAVRRVVPSSFQDMSQRKYLSHDVGLGKIPN